MSTETRNRVQKGVSTGGQFSTESRSEAAGVALKAAPVSHAEAFLEEADRSQRAVESATRIARHTRLAAMSSAVHEAFGPDAKIMMKQENGQFRAEGVLGDGPHDVDELDKVVGRAARYDFEHEFSKFDDVNAIGYPDEKAPGVWLVPVRPGADHLRPGLSLRDSAAADERDELDIRRELSEMDIYSYRVDFYDNGQISAWKGHRPCGSREDGLYDAEQAPEQTAAMQAVFDQHQDLTRTSLRWGRPGPDEQAHFKV